ncbi:MAG: alpha/beta hydrolase [Anaerolineae bacterium]|nr:alpha/beta hydrolase [Anaerolineae bacterium]
MIKKFARALSFLAAWMGLLTVIRFPSRTVGRLMYGEILGKSPVMLAIGRFLGMICAASILLPKVLADIGSPFVAILGGIGALLGLLSGDKQAASGGVIGAALLGRHLRRVTASHDGFDRAFGPGWESRIPPDLQPRLAPGRWQFPASEPPPAIPGWQRNVVFGAHPGTGEPLLCDVWQPPAGVQRTGVAVIYLHGTLWQALDKDFLTRSFFRRLAGQGHLVMDVAYSLVPRTDLRGITREVKRAIAWLKANAACYCINPERVVLIGSSGGGHLALLAAYTPNYPDFQPANLAADTSVRGVVSLYGPTDLTVFFDEYGKIDARQPEYSTEITDDMRPRVFNRSIYDRVITTLRILPAYRYHNMPVGPLVLIDALGGTLKEVPEAYRLHSPISHIGSHCPPTLQIFGAHDFFVDPEHGRRLHLALVEAGVPSVLVELPGVDHGFDINPFRRLSPAAQVAEYDIERFLALMA